MPIELSQREKDLINIYACNLYNRGFINDYDFYVKNIEESNVSKMVEAELIMLCKALKKEIYHEVSDVLLNHAMTDTPLNDNVINPTEQKQEIKT